MNVSDSVKIVFQMNSVVIIISNSTLYVSNGGINRIGGQSGAAVRRPHGSHQDVGSNPAAARNEKTDIGQTPAQKVPQ